jgi:hypothetical protein
VHNYVGSKIISFFSFPEGNRIGGSLAAGDVDADGLAEIVVGAGRGGGPQVRVFNQHGQLEFQFFAFSELFRGGVNVAVGNIFENPAAEIIVAPARSFEPRVFVFNNKTEKLLEFLAYNRNFIGGVSLAASQ